MYLRHLFAYEEAARRIPASTRVIDIGCGEGYGTARLARTARRAVGIDVDPATIAQAARRYGRSTCHYLFVRWRAPPFASGAVDAATTFQVIEHVPDDQRFVADAACLLRPGGILIVTTPNRLLRLGAGERPWNRSHVREYAPTDLRETLMPYFAVEMFGVEGDAETQAHELARLAWIRRTVARDPFGLRRLLSEDMKRRVLMMLRRGVEGPGTKPGVTGRTTDRYRLTSNASESLDLFAVCTS